MTTERVDLCACGKPEEERCLHGLRECRPIERDGTVYKRNYCVSRMEPCPEHGFSGLPAEGCPWCLDHQTLRRGMETIWLRERIRRLLEEQ